MSNRSTDKKIKIISFSETKPKPKIIPLKDYPVPVYTQQYTPPQVDLKLLNNQQTIDAIKAQVQKFKQSKTENPEGPLKNVKISQYYNQTKGNKIKLPQIYKFQIIGRTNIGQNYYSGRKFQGRIEFPNNYPFSPPKIFMNFLKNKKPVKMVNLYADGQICHYTINPQTYQLKFDLPYILKQLQGLLYSPNPNSPADPDIGRYFKLFPEKYWEFQKQQAKYLSECGQ